MSDFQGFNARQMFVAGIAVETVLWVANSVLVVLIIYLLACPGRKFPGLCLCCTVMYIAATFQTSISFYQLFHMSSFADLRVESYFYWDTSLSRAAQCWIYTICAVKQDIILMWRLYVLSEQKWKFIVLPVAVEITATVCFFVAQAPYLTRSSKLLSDEPASAITRTWTAYWALNLALNVGLPLAIAWRLWFADRRLQSITGPQKETPYTIALRAILESGSIYAVAITCVFILFFIDTFTLVEGLNILTQFATMVPLIIVFRAALRRRREWRAEQQGDTLDRSPATKAVAMHVIEIDTTKVLDIRRSSVEMYGV